MPGEEGEAVKGTPSAGPKKLRSLAQTSEGILKPLIDARSIPPTKRIPTTTCIQNSEAPKYIIDICVRLCTYMYTYMCKYIYIYIYICVDLLVPPDFRGVSTCRMDTANQ